ncbi:MAG: manganese efflux pump MntP family protein, partial [Methanobrevibacter sp.]|nr:manganese efflux pump MntP family protein [Methanobrevibacter sp.]
NIKTSQIILIGLFFGGFQVLMPIIGWVAGEQIRNLISSISPFIAFFLLLIISLKMIHEAINKDSKENNKENISIKELTILAIATSIDAFVVGVSFSFLSIPIVIPAIIIGIVTFIISEIGVVSGKKIGNIFGDKFEVLGGLILILLAVKFLLDGLNNLGFF